MLTMKTRTLLGILALSCVGAWGQAVHAADAFTVAVRGEKPTCTIVVATNASPTVLRAAEELRAYTEKMTGVTLPVAAVAKPGTAALVLEETDRHGVDGFALKGDARQLVVSGGRRGVLYGAWELLEEYGGCGWFASWQEIVPSCARFVVPLPLDVVRKPAFRMRDLSYQDVNRNPLLAARLRLNGPRTHFPAELGGPSEYAFDNQLGVCHTVTRILPPAEFAKTHPEYYGLVDGKRIVDEERRPQLCLTNPDVRRLSKERVLKRIRANPRCKYFGISQGDSTRTLCQCANCKASDHKYGDAPSGTFLAYVNEIAEAVEKEFPDVVIETLAYRYTRKPPVGIVPRRNVMPCFCTIECDFSRPIPESDFAENVALVKDIREWRKISPYLYVWDYTVNFSHYHYPFANFRALQGNLRFFRECGVEQIFEQGDSLGLHAWFGELRAWLLAKLEWNPDADVPALLDRFFKGYYGAASDLARADFEAAHALGRGGAADPVTIYERVDCTNLPNAFLAASDARWAAAAKLVRNDPVRASNVAWARLCVDYARVMRHISTHKDPPIFASRHPERFRTPEALEMQAAGQRIASFMNGAVKPRFSEGKGSNEAIWKRLSSFVAAPLPEHPVEKVTLGVREFNVASIRAKVVRDETAHGGQAYLFPNTHHQWSGHLYANSMMLDPGAKFRVRIHLKAYLPTDAVGEVFRAGVYNYDLKKAIVRDNCIKVEKIKPGEWQWIDLFVWEPKGVDMFWVSPGVFDTKRYPESPAFTSVLLDAIELERVD